MLSYLLDTNMCIYVKRQRPPLVLARFSGVDVGDAAISVITYGELVYGAEKSDRRTRVLRDLREFVGLVAVLPLPQEAAEAYANIRAGLERKGEMIGNNDLWIAAHARAAGLILVTNNVREFRRVPGLKIENWAV